MLSICIPAYTYVDYTVEAVSVLLKEPEDFEIVAVEDFDLVAADPDMARRIAHARELFGSDPRIVWRRNGEPRPIQDNWNFTVDLASRPYVKLMGADDRICPGGVSKILTMIRSAPTVHFHGHLARIIDGDGHIVRLQRPYVRSRACHRTGSNDALRLKLRQIARFKEPACNLFTKDAWRRVSGYSRQYRFCFDIDFNIKVMREHDCCLWNEYVVDLRRHARSDGATLPPDLALDELRQLIDDIYRFLGTTSTPSDRASGEAWLTYRLIELGVARYRHSPRRMLEFLAANLRKVDLSFSTLARVTGLLARRACFNDVQRTLP